MPAAYEKTLLFAQFLDSSTKHWVRFLPALPLQAAYYWDATVGNDVLHRFLLHLTKHRSGTQTFCRISLAIGSHTRSDGGLLLEVTSTERDVEIEMSCLNFADAKWAKLNDPVVRKARSIAVACSDALRPLTAANAHSVH
jgi:hypothetical protein